MRKLSKTLLSLLLIAAMLASFVVLPAAAEEPAAEQPTEAVQASTSKRQWNRSARRQAELSVKTSPTAFSSASASESNISKQR